MADPTQWTLQSPPFDSISQVRFSPANAEQLLVSSWDTTVRFYDTGDTDRPNEQKAKFDHRAAVLGCCWSDGANAYSGGLDCTVRHLALETEKSTPIGAHDDSISSMVWSTSSNALITGSWDRTLRFWDPRADSPQQTSSTMPERVYSIDIVGHMLVLAMASRLVRIYDTRRMEAPLQERESSLKYLTRSLACMANGEGYAMASTEGRIAVEYFDAKPEVQANKYAFKCHRQTIEGVDHVWPVNALAFHPTYNMFASAGSDGIVSIWDPKAKKRLRQLNKFNNPVSSVAFSCDGARLAIASSYTWDEGEAGAKTAERPGVTVKKLGDDVKVRFFWFWWEGLIDGVFVCSRSRRSAHACCTYVRFVTRSFFVVFLENNVDVDEVVVVLFLCSDFLCSWMLQKGASFSSFPLTPSVHY
ncbi:WD40-repeat-containing domain protein [Armillaria luteobubalina]|uniref:WD40-repeat-containing domain protein n=1 Tax=Armillaria luteobubalina TaxID=153913 RepID=A0AA39PH52_9AGAR|nr:WD40-repeat-containing domain protein [Armillaria luteobubalina]